MSSRLAIFLTMRRELRERLRSRAFQVATAIQIVIVVGIVIVAGVTGDDTETFKVGAVGERAASVGERLEPTPRASTPKIELETLADEAAAESAVSDEDVEAAVVDDRLLTGSTAGAGLVALLQDASRAGPRRREPARGRPFGGAGPRDAAAAAARGHRARQRRAGEGIALVGSPAALHRDPHVRDLGRRRRGRGEELAGRRGDPLGDPADSAARRQGARHRPAGDAAR